MAISTLDPHHTNGKPAVTRQSPGVVYTDKLQERILAALRERDATSDCPRCGHESFTLIRGFHFLPLHKEIPPPGQALGASSEGVPVVLVGCEKCGNISSHSLGVLGFTEADVES